MKTEQELYEEIWQGQAQGLNYNRAIEELNELQTLERGLENKTIRPSKIIGTGYKNPRKVAYSWINKQRESLLMAIATDGRSSLLNQGNVQYRLKQQTKEKAN